MQTKKKKKGNDSSPSHPRQKSIGICGSCIYTIIRKQMIRPLSLTLMLLRTREAACGGGSEAQGFLQKESDAGGGGDMGP